MPDDADLIDALVALVRHGEALVAALGNSAADEMHEAGRQARESLAAAVNVAETYVRDNPWKTITLAACVGFLIGAWVSRPRPE